MNNDLVNACFELLGGVFIFLNVRRLYYDKTIRGVSVITMSFFTVWSYWSLYYYLSLGQVLSFLSAILFMIFSTVWIVMVVYYYKKRKRGTKL